MVAVRQALRPSRWTLRSLPALCAIASPAPKGAAEPVHPRGPCGVAQTAGEGVDGSSGEAVAVDLDAAARLVGPSGWRGAWSGTGPRPDVRAAVPCRTPCGRHLAGPTAQRIARRHRRGPTVKREAPLVGHGSEKDRDGG